MTDPTSKTLRIAVLDDYQHASRGFEAWSRLARHDIVFFDRHLGDLDAVAEALRDFDVICSMRERTAFPPALFARLPRLRLLTTTGMANASIDLEAARAHGVTVCGTRGSAAGPSELTWGLILALARKIPHEDRSLRAGAWQTSVGVELHGKTLGVLGLGRIGGAIARVGNAFGMNVIAWSENLTDERAAEAGAELVSRETLFRAADVLTVHLRLSDRTRNLVGAAELSSMKPTALLINTSRGPIVDEAALLSALEDGAIAGAALDVFDVEPLPAGHPLLRAPNLVLTPHLGYVTDASYKVFFGETIENIEAFEAGVDLRILTPPWR